MQNAAQYEERVADAPEPEAFDFDTAIGQDDEYMAQTDESRPASPARASPFGIPEVSRQNVDPDDISELLEHRQNRSLEMSLFEKGLAIFADLIGMSRDHYESLLALLNLLTFENGEAHLFVRQLPKQLSTLKSRIRSRLPLT